MTQLSREVRQCPGLRYELIVQAQEGPDISALEKKGTIDGQLG